MMADINSVINEFNGRKIAIYGLGTETERFLLEWGDKLSIVCLLDGFKSEGEMYGYPILAHQEAVDLGVKLIIVVARPGSCKAIAKKIGPLCRANGIALFDVRGKDLLETSEVTFEFSGINAESKQVLEDKINNAEVVSFDLFDTLIVRKVYSYTDIFELVDIAIRKRGVFISDFCDRRLSAEKELSKLGAPRLEVIYEDVLNKSGTNAISAKELSELEWETDLATLMPRYAMRDIFRECISLGKRVVITTDSYYCQGRIEEILDKFEITGYEKLLVSCEYDCSKTQGLFDKVNELSAGRVLHIGDDVASDIEPARNKGFDAFKIISSIEYFDVLGGMAIEDHINSLSDRVRSGLFISRAFNDPFCFEIESKFFVRKAEDIGYMFFAPMISDFVLWLKNETTEQGYEQILFGARDGYLIDRLYRKIDPGTVSLYFLTSRTAAIRAGVEDMEDIEYVNSMRFFGSDEDALYARFGIETKDSLSKKANELILEKAAIQRINYLRYIEKTGIGSEKLAIFDFVAKGTTQMYLGRLFDQHMKGFYFLQLEPEYMADRNLDIQPFYTDEEKNSSEIFDNYYILETMLTAPYPQLEEFDENGEPIYATETRSEADIRCFERAQSGMEEYFDDYINLVPEEAWSENKKLDEAFLSLVNKVKICDEDFLALTVEDPFFGRMTDIRDVIG